MALRMARIVCMVCFAILIVSVLKVNAATSDKPFIFGLLLVGPYNDRGWSQAHYEAGLYVEKKIPGSKMIYIDKVNPADRSGVTIVQLVDDMVEEGAKLIIANSDDMKDGTREAASMYPNIHFLHISGDDALTKKADPNLSKLRGRMEYGKMIAGFAAAMTSKTGKIGYLGPLVNEETRRMAVSCYLGAKYAWEHVLDNNAANLNFKVTWIGFWFNIPGVTADPIQVAQNLFDTGYDVVISGIDTTEALVVAGQKHRQGKRVWAIPYNYIGACNGGSDVCLGVPYFNWGPDFVKFVKASIAGKWQQQWVWSGPNWKEINNLETSAIGFQKGPALSLSTSAALDHFIADLGGGKLNLFTGPLNYNDGTPFLESGKIADDRAIWYMENLLEGMDGSVSNK